MQLYQKDMLISESLVGFYDVFDTYFWSNAHIYHKEKYGGDNKNIYSSRLEYLNETFAGDNKELMVSRFLYGTLLSVKNLHVKNSDREELKERRKELLAFVEENLPSVQHIPFRTKLSEYLAETKAYHVQLDTTAYVSESLDLSQYPDGERFWKELIKTHENKVLYVKFWAPWCGPCMGDWPAIEKLESRLQDEDFAIINLCFNTKREHWEKAIAKYHISGNNYLLTGDQTNILKKSLNFSAIPHQIIVDKSGNIADDNAQSPYGKGGTLNPVLTDKLITLIETQE